MKNLRRTALPRRHATILKIILLLALLAAFGQTAFAKAVGTVKSITGNSVVLTTDSGEVTVTLINSTRILRASPDKLT